MESTLTLDPGRRFLGKLRRRRSGAPSLEPSRPRQARPRDACPRRRQLTWRAVAEVVSTSNFRNGMHISLDGHFWRIVEFQHVKPGKGGAFVRTKLKSIDTDAVADRTFRAGEKFERVRTETKNMQYLYDAGPQPDPDRGRRSHRAGEARAGARRLPRARPRSVRGR